MRKRHRKIIKKKQTNDENIHKNNYPLSENNRLTYVYKTDLEENIIQVVCVSLEIKIENKWKTIVYYDSSHDDVLHRHTVTSLESDADVVDYLGVRKKGSQKKLLKWAIEDIQNNYIQYKNKFIKRCRKLGIIVDIEMY